MPRRIRYIRPDILDDDIFGRLPFEAQFLYLALPCFMDSQGITIASPEWVKSKVFTYRKDMPEDHVLWILLTLCEVGYYKLLRDSTGRMYVKDQLFDGQFTHNRETPVYPPESEMTLCDHSIWLENVKPSLSLGSAQTMESTTLRNEELGIRNYIALASPKAPLGAKKKRSPPPKGCLPDLIEFETLLASVGHAIQTRWISKYGIAVLSRELRRAEEWEMLNPTRVKTDKGKFINNWLNNRDKYPSVANPTPASEDAPKPRTKGRFR